MKHANANLQRESVEKIYDCAAELLINQQKPPIQVKLELIRKGLSESEAEIVVDRLSDQLKRDRQKKAKRDIVFGALWLVCGIVITVVTIMSASGSNIRYMISYGAVFLGVIRLVKGIVAYFKK